MVMGGGDAVLWGLLAIRLLCLAPRPYFWLRAYRLLQQARCEPTPQLLAARLVEIRAPDSPWVKAMQ